MKKSLQLLTSLLLLTLLALPASAWANTAANTQIINNATLTFNGGSASASVIVTVALVASTPNVALTGGSSAYTAANTPLINNSLTITSTANGPASYTVAPSVTTSINTTSPSVSGGTSVMVGASVTTGISTTTSLTVPSDGVSGAAVNGIGVNSTIVFTVGVTTYTRPVTGVTNTGSGTATITFGGVAIPTPASAGTPVYEQKVVTLPVLPGTVIATGLLIEVHIQAVVSTSGAANVTVQCIPHNTWTTPSANVQITKYVRNATTDASLVGTPSATSLTINGVPHNYYVSSANSGVSGKPTDQLEYVIVAKNIGATAINGCYISDVIPTSYVSFATGQIAGKDIWYINPAGTGVGLFAADQGSYASPNLTVNVGNSAAAATPGTIPALGQVTIAYRLVIN